MSDMPSRRPALKDEPIETRGGEAVDNDSVQETVCMHMHVREFCPFL